MKAFVFFIVVCIISIQINAQNLDVDTIKFKILKQVKATPVKNQAMSSTCWSFATISFIESELIRMGKGEFDLSEMYIARHALHDKAIMHVRMLGNNFYTPGGQSHDVLNQMQKHGIVPENIYTGRVKGEISHNHSVMNTALFKMVKYYCTKSGKDLPLTWINRYDSIIDVHLGKLPEKFEYQGKTYTPVSFYQSLDLKAENYIEIASCTNQPYYKPFCLESRFNWSNGLYYNVPLDDFMEIIDYAINNNYSVAWNGDVSETTFDFWSGLATVPEYENKVNSAVRQFCWDNHTTTVDHVMHITGIAVDKNNTKYYLTKNSWGKRNNYQGYMYLTESFLKLKTVSFMVHKQAIPITILKKLGLQITN